MTCKSKSVVCGAGMVGAVIGIGLMIAIVGCTSQTPAGPVGPITGGIPSAPSTTSTGPIGIFYNRFTGPVNGTELIQVLATSQSGVYNFTTLEGQGLVCRVDSAGIITVLSGIGGITAASGTGRFTSNYGAFDLTPTITVTGWPANSVFVYAANRVPGTDSSFPLLATALQTNCLVLGNYSVSHGYLDLVTGQSLPGTLQAETATVAFYGTAARITLTSLAYYQGIFISDFGVAFRYVPGAYGTYASFPNSTNNVGQNMVGHIGFANTGRLTGLLIFETRGPRGTQLQTLLSLTGDVIGQFGALCPAEPVTLNITNYTHDELNVRVFASTDHDVEKCDLLRSSSIQANTNLSYMESTRVDLSGDVTASFVVAVTPVSATTCRDADCSFWVGLASQVYRQPENFNDGDSLQFQLTGNSATCYGITGP